LTTVPGGRRFSPGAVGFSTIFWKTQGWEERRWIFSRTVGNAGGDGFSAVSILSLWASAPGCPGFVTGHGLVVGIAAEISAMEFELIPFLILGGIIAVVVIVAVYGYYAQKKRTEAMSRNCEMMNFTFTPVLGKDGLGFFSPYTLFNRGHSKKGRNLMKGKIGENEVILLDYHYTTGSGKHQQTHTQTVIVLPD
jgi:hypothetical protein